MLVLVDVRRRAEVDGIDGEHERVESGSETLEVGRGEAVGRIGSVGNDDRPVGYRDNAAVAHVGVRAR